MLDLRERCLELFKVTSKCGVAEVWLLGQRLLELPSSAVVIALADECSTGSVCPRGFT